MSKLIEIVNNFVNNILNNDALTKGINALKWVANIAIFADEEGVIYRSTKEKGIILPEAEGAEIVNAIIKAQANMESAQKAAESKLKLTGWSEAEEAYKNAKAELVKQGKYGTPMEEIPFGKEVADFRKQASEGDVHYELAQKWYWNILPQGKGQFFSHATHSGYVVRGLDSFFATPVLADDHPFKDTYWDEMRVLLPSWVVKALKKDAQNRLPIEQRINRSNGTYDYNNNRNRTKNEEEKTDSDILFKILSSRLRGMIDTEDVFACEGNPSSLLKKVHEFVAQEEINAYAVAYRLIEIVNSGWIDGNELMKVCNWDKATYSSFIQMYEEGVAINTKQNETKVIDSYVGKWYCLGLMANVSKDTQLAMLKSGMIANLKKPEVYARMLRAKDTKKALWNAYSAIDYSEKKDTHLNTEALMKLSGNYNKVCEEAGNAIQQNNYAIRKLCETVKFDLNTGNTDWDNFLKELRETTLEEVGNIADRIVVDFRRPLAGSESSENINDLAMVKAAYLIFNECSKKVVSCFGTM